MVHAAGGLPEHFGGSQGQTTSTEWVVAAVGAALGLWLQKVLLHGQ